ncbi:MAG TPA: BsuBI/PstI family type II restriction endonuclease, partial [Spirochaetota bacterium]|nr:BsuBI/PstI family type II restriction endonuclease [Spirochaetota bacterium]
MGKIEEAKEILKALGLPVRQQNDRSALTLLALCNLKEDQKWKSARQVSMSVVGNRDNPRYEGIMRFIALHYKRRYAENSRETFRRQTLHQFVQAGIASHNPENPDLPTNSKDNHYRLTNEALDVIKTYGTKRWTKALDGFKRTIGTLQGKYEKERALRKIPVTLANGKKLKFSPGKHNEVQIAVINEFAPRFAPGSMLLYVGDTAKKDLFIERAVLNELRVPIDQHGKLPDVVLYDKDRNWMYLVEAVTSHGPISPKRFIELELMFRKCGAGLVYVSAFPDYREFRKHVNDIAWETEVWLADIPDHMIHFNGDKFIG